MARADNPAADNIRAIVDLERRALAEARWSDRISDAISAFAGSRWFVINRYSWRSAASGSIRVA